MDLITSKVSCVKFELATSSSVNFVTIINGPDCSSDQGMQYGEQRINLNPRCFDNGLMTPVQELLHTLGLPKEPLREPNPEDPLSLGDKVKDFTHTREVHKMESF